MAQSAHASVEHLSAERLARANAALQKALREACQELSRIKRVRNEFLTTLSHELRTPLTSVLGWCHLLRCGDLDQEEHDEALKAVERNASLQLRLVDDLLQLSQEVTGEMTIERTAIDLLDVLRQTAAAIRPAADAKMQKLRVAANDDSLPLLADAERLRQVFWHLLSNAVKFTPSNGLISVTAEMAGGLCTVTVRDTGKGIAKDFIGHVFDSFAQEDGSRSRTFGGLGVGLSIVRHLVELHGGQIDVSSDGEGCGATFKVTLPAISSPSQWQI